jgi:thioredoxin 1
MGNFKELIEGNEPVLVDFFAVWCGPCQGMHPVLEALKKEVGERIRIVKIDIDAPGNRSLVAQYGIRSVPTLFFFRDGKTVWKQTGAVGLDVLRKVVNDHG